MRVKRLWVTGVILAAGVIQLLWATTTRGRALNVPGEYETIQAAIYDANNGDQIVLAPGSYYENIVFAGIDCTLSGSAPNDPGIVGTTIIDGMALGSVIEIHGTNTIIRGLSITNGMAEAGGGIRIPDGGSVELDSCIVANNRTLDADGEVLWRGGDGGGIYINGASAVIRDCVITENETGGDSNPEDSFGAESGHGGGICCFYSVLTLQNSEITQNKTANGGHGYPGADAGNGAGVYISAGSGAIITGCLISVNTTGEGGTGVDLLEDGGDGGDGAGIYSEFTDTVITNCTIVQNSCGPGGPGGGMGGPGEGVNGADGIGGGVYSRIDTTIGNSIIWDNQFDQVAGVGCDNVMFCNIGDGICEASLGIISTDPCFTDAGGWDFRLLEGSPCIDAGHNSLASIGPAVDLDWNPRIADGDNDMNDIVDMGAYEFPAVSAPLGPDPMTWLGEPNAISDMAVSMTATTATGTGEIQYYFECVAGPGHNSGWQASESYTDTPVASETWYAYRVKARDGFMRETDYSSTAWVQTLSTPEITEGLIAYWPMEEGSGNIVSDASGNGNHGTFSSPTSPVWDSGKWGGGLMFGGGAYVDCGNASIFDVNEEVSAAAWVNITSVPTDWTAILSKGNDAWRLSTVYSTTAMHFGVTGIPDHWSINGETELTPGEWYYVMGTYDGGSIRIFVDGIEDANAVAYSGGVAANSDNVWIGGNSDKPGREFDGLIDEAAVWDRALRIENIDWLFNDGVGNPIVEREGIYVDDDAPYDPAPGDSEVSDPNEDGSWTHPFDSIYEAMDFAESGDVITVLDGLYSGYGNRNLEFNGKAMTVRSENGPVNCIINCQDFGSGFLFLSGEGADSIVDGFTITNGFACCDYPRGGGIYCDMSSPTIRNCIIAGNEAEQSGGGIYVDYGSPRFENCAILNNTAVSGGGLAFWKSDVTLINCTIRNNSPDGVSVNFGSAAILGTVQIVSDSIVGDGYVQIDPNSTLRMENSRSETRIEGLGRILVPAGKGFMVENNGMIDLTDEAYPLLQGTLDCKGLLVVRDTGSLTRTAVTITRGIFEDNSVVSNNVFTTNALIPYGQISLEDDSTFINNDIHATGDRYIDVEPAEFTGTISNIRIYITQYSDRGGLFELRGEEMFCEGPTCESGLIAIEEVPDFDTVSWTLESLELVEGAKLILTNRDDYQPPYDTDGENEAAYVKHLILGPNSIIDTSFNRLYYESLTMDPSAKVINKALLGYSLDRIVFTDEEEYSNRVANNNTAEGEFPRIGVERLTSSELDPSGLMIMRNLADEDPTSPTYGQIIGARAKGLFSRSVEGELLVRFRYMFNIAEEDSAVAVYLSDVPELLEKDDPERAAHYLYVGLLSPPPFPRAGSPGSDRFAVFEKKVPTEGLDFSDGTYVELELIEPGESTPLSRPEEIMPYMEKEAGLLAIDSRLPVQKSMLLEGSGGVGGTSITIDDWGPEVHCDGICLDITRDALVDEVDFLTVIGECGLPAELDPNETAGRACLEGAYSDDSYVDLLDITGWDWTLGDEDRTYLCDGIPLSEAESSGSPSEEVFFIPIDEGAPLASVPGSLDDLLVLGKRNDSSASLKLADRIYTFGDDGGYTTWFAPSSGRYNLRVVEGPGDELYQVNSEDGVVRLDATDEMVVPSGVCTNVNEPRYDTAGAIVYVGIQLDEGAYEDESIGRPILDAAFDENYVYVVPVVVKSVGHDAYTAAARLELLSSGDPPYCIDRLYDDPPPPGDNQYRNALREIEIDDSGNAYVINSHGLNESDILWKYEPNGVFQRVDLGVPGSSNYVSDPVALFMSVTTDILYMSSGQYNSEDHTKTEIYGYSTSGLLSRTRTITVHGMHHVSSITEDPQTGTLYVAGFNMDSIPLYPDETAVPFYTARLAKIPYGATSATASGFGGAHDLALPMSMLWTKTVKCGGTNIAGSASINFTDYAIIGEHFLDTNCTPPTWCDGADIDLSKSVGMSDVAILAEYWLANGCSD
ncbi:MAG: hypothetical protein JW720_06060 [Sedimentisphaerales bacterium]|nr:hypothetical protein [Sedimentisphaerales bacterium]